MRRLLALVGLGPPAVLVILAGAYTASVALHPYSSVPIPASCSKSVSHLPPRRAYALPEGGGTGTLLARRADTAVVVTAGYGREPFQATVRMVNQARGEIVRSLTFDNDVLAVAIQGGVVYLYDDKLLYLVDGTTGSMLHGLIRIDNYRGLYTTSGGRRLQTSAAISSLGFHGAAFSQLHLHFATMAFGCYFP